MPIPLQNPYGTDPSRFKISARISPSDFQFFKDLFPADGSIDAVVSTLFKTLVDELRQRNAEQPLERAWYVDSRTYTVIISILQRGTTRQPARQEGPRDEPRGASGVRKMDGDPPVERPVTQSSAPRRKSGTTEKGKGSKKG